MLLKILTNHIGHAFGRIVNNALLILGEKNADILNSEYMKDGYKDKNYVWDGMFVKTDKYGRPIKVTK